MNWIVTQGNNVLISNCLKNGRTPHPKQTFASKCPTVGIDNMQNADKYTRGGRAWNRERNWIRPHSESQSSLGLQGSCLNYVGVLFSKTENS